MSLRLVIACSYSSKRVSRAQHSWAAAFSWVFAVSGIMAWLILSSGCGSVYHRTQDQLPSEPGGELKLRLAEAVAAENRVKLAGLTLRKSLSDPKSRGRMQTDFDRLEARVFDFERRVLTVRDRAAASGNIADAESVDRLAALAEVWLAYVGRGRVEASPDLRELEALLK